MPRRRTAPAAGTRADGRGSAAGPTTPALGLGTGEQWALDQVRRHGVGTFVAWMTLVAIAASVVVVVGSLVVVGAGSDEPHWTRALVIGVLTPIVVGPPILFLSARLVARLDVAIRLLQESVVTDALTGVANRRGFFDALEAVETRRAASGGDRVEVAMIDVDDFKAINDARGHPTGDTALCMVAAWLQQEVGDRGIVGRLGGDEFAYVAVVDPSSPPPPARREFRLDGLEFSVSIGRAQARGGDLHAALLDADADLYRQKQTRAPAVPRRTVRTDQRGGSEE